MSIEALVEKLEQAKLSWMQGEEIKIEFIDSCIELGRQAIAEEERQEPVGYADTIAFDEAMRVGKGCDVWPVKGDYEQRTGRKLRPLYTTPQQRKPLTDERITAIARKHWGYAGMNTAELAFVRDIEAAHGIKGEA
jgi:hypothetical protein